MKTSRRFPAFIAYLLPVIGWLIVVLFYRKNPFAMFHLRQAIGLFMFLLIMFGGWAVVAWVIAWIPYMAALSAALFTMVIVSYIYGVVIWIMGMRNALNERVVYLPVFGRIANQLPI